jgi:hypothetical protein
MIDKMGHTWSGGSSNGSYTDPSGPNATEIIWNFFSKHQQQPEEKLIKTPANTLVPSSVNPQDEPPSETPKKNFLSLLLSKLRKKKN